MRLSAIKRRAVESARCETLAAGARVPLFAPLHDRRRGSTAALRAGKRRAMDATRRSHQLIDEIHANQRESQR